MLENFESSYDYPLMYGLRDEMTLISALRDGDRLLVASDGIATDEHLMRQQAAQKTWDVSGSQLVWGYSGASALGDEFRLLIESGSPKKWQALTQWTANTVVDLNDPWRGRCERSGIPRKDMGLVSILIAGWLDKQPGILQVNEAGMHSTPTNCQTTFIGSGAGAATLLHAAFDGEATEAILHKIMNVVAAKLRDCGPPLTCWEIPQSSSPRLLDWQESVV